VKRRRVVWARAAQRDLDGIVSYVAADSPQAGLALLDKLEARAKSLNTMADRGRLVPELARLHIRHYRELVVAPYRLLYRATSREVLMVAVYDARRSLEDVLLERLIRIGEGEE
jgi:plasmid stabilization system protein ParE